ncbi:rRNA maturation RNase YbeY [Bosea caraganae]|uniref:Endoribonuclease YbeY n=1 Tax=Bosea caraganae TaxID=2763117 RepID=A0A370L8B5_9HYPH|nr:rRNA maturation RNase YbeY [Bosea caraganae]RDJ26619.1 rRNA maturation RNase YbeY [Bosea caraganae]RDJ30505.1 rRNA maturation RNase YbeY [Bosea caraganae]
MNDRPPTRRQAPRPDRLTISIRLQSRRWRELGDLRERVSQATEAALAVSEVKPLPGAELSLLMTDDKRIRSVNRDWRGLDKATNVLSFPAAPPERITASPVLGDIVLAFETVLREAEDEGKSPGDHLSHLVVHGLLHLLGEDHETESEAIRMEGLEIAALARLGIADPYAGAELDTASSNQPRIDRPTP